MQAQKTKVLAATVTPKPVRPLQRPKGPTQAPQRHTKGRTRCHPRAATPKPRAGRWAQLPSPAWPSSLRGPRAASGDRAAGAQTLRQGLQVVFQQPEEGLVQAAATPGGRHGPESSLGEGRGLCPPFPLSCHRSVATQRRGGVCTLAPDPTASWAQPCQELGMLNRTLYWHPGHGCNGHLSVRQPPLALSLPRVARNRPCVGAEHKGRTSAPRVAASQSEGISRM